MSSDRAGAIEYNGHKIPVSVAWKFLQAMMRRRPSSAEGSPTFDLVMEILRKAPSYGSLDQALSLLESTYKVPRTALFEQIIISLAGPQQQQALQQQPLQQQQALQQQSLQQQQVQLQQQRRYAPPKPAAVRLFLPFVKEVCAKRRLRPLAPDVECAELILTFLTRWLHNLWVQLLGLSFKRIDCPGTVNASAIASTGASDGDGGDDDNLRINDDVWFQHHVQRVSSSRARSRSGSGLSGEPGGGLPSFEASAAARIPRADPAGATASLAGLEDLGLAAPVLFDAVGGENAAAERSASSAEKLRATPTALGSDQREHVRTLHAVRRRQAKLTREISVDDIYTALSAKTGVPPPPHRFHMPAGLKAEILQYLNLLLPHNPHEIVDLANQCAPIAVRNAALNCYIPLGGHAAAQARASGTPANDCNPGSSLNASEAAHVSSKSHRSLNPSSKNSRAGAGEGKSKRRRVQTGTAGSASGKAAPNMQPSSLVGPA